MWVKDDLSEYSKTGASRFPGTTCITRAAATPRRHSPCWSMRCVIGVNSGAACRVSALTAVLVEAFVKNYGPSVHGLRAYERSLSYHRLDLSLCIGQLLGSCAQAAQGNQSAALALLERRIASVQRSVPTVGDSAPKLFPLSMASEVLSPIVRRIRKMRSKCQEKMR